MVVVVIEIKAKETASTFIISRNPNSAEHKFRRSPYRIETNKKKCFSCVGATERLYYKQ
jgi:hypothetical protein